jgi:hypothetical protein
MLWSNTDIFVPLERSVLLLSYWKSAIKVRATRCSEPLHKSVELNENLLSSDFDYSFTFISYIISFTFMSLVTANDSTSLGGTSFSYLSIGHSWSSGVFDFRSADESYNGYANRYWRWKYAWPVLMAQDNT